MTDAGLLESRLPEGWWAEPVRAAHHPALAAFIDAVPSHGRKFPATAAGVADVFAHSVPSHSLVLRDASGDIGGYTVLYEAADDSSVVNAGAGIGDDAPEGLAAAAVAALVAGFTESAPSKRSLRVFSTVDPSPLSAALAAAGFGIEASFWGKRRAVAVTDAALPSVPGITVLGWAEVEARGLGELVRQAQHETFLHHFGELSKDEAAWRHHLAGPVFEPRFSFAALAGADDPVVAGGGVLGGVQVAGYALGSNYTDDALGHREVNAHTDYIGVRAPWRRRGIARLLLAHVWHAALEAGLPAASLGVDTANEHDAAALYDALGYRTLHHNAAWSLTVP
ncbi:GNAT family N-acetyltransferase [Herbiconiux sp. CPCC 203407]|uniref:GNAT family N-acetyltransferase n=1 Tax=Herbiconiux oxytropis TaxID=2970915 RepID=A0AA42BTZ3_9MICO|nr:GNAT family N-acetyltransferase [Herbiconiux oxytropis]MCS5724087.1 GNAT family N-acetyltransferase [Herbiconiux oxytropis]MCS5726980.1 GNAT family N-acetyltransferase [Herbiconiux oxytropis]